MKITGIRTHLGFARWRNWLFLQIETDEGITGVGEATLEGREKTVEAAVHDLERSLLGTDPFDIENTWQNLYYRNGFWVGGPILLTAISGIEMALWDIAGKKLGVPVYRLLGGKCRDRIRVYANGWYFGAKTPGDFASMAHATVAAGYTALKWDPFGFADRTLSSPELEYSIDCVRAVREAVGPRIDLLVEGHGRFNVYTAIKIAKKLEPIDIFFFEEPVPPENYDALREVKEAGNVPIATGERCYLKFGYRDLLEKRATHIIQPDVMHAGGILETFKIAAMADAHYIPVAPHNPNGPIAHAAAVQLCTCISNLLILEYLVNDVSWRDEAVTHPLPVIDGHIPVPTAPGLGTGINIDVIARHPYQPVDLSLFTSAPEKNVMLRPSE